jgi:hypothetical protein
MYKRGGKLELEEFYSLFERERRLNGDVVSHEAKLEDILFAKEFGLDAYRGKTSGLGVRGSKKTQLREINSLLESERKALMRKAIPLAATQFNSCLLILPTTL